MSQGNKFVFIALTVIAWIIFVGLCIEACGLTVNFIFTVFKPEMLGNLYQKLDLTDMYNQSRWTFFSVYSFILFVSYLKAHLFYVLINLLHKLNLTKPFNNFVSEQITKISYITFSVGLISYIASQVCKSLPHYGYRTEHLNQFWEDSQAFILMAAVVYVIATIFKKGVEIQNENDFTV